MLHLFGIANPYTTVFTMMAILQEGSGRSIFEILPKEWNLIAMNSKTKYEPEETVNPSQPLCNAKLYRNVFLMWS